jgi:hypothetical protein
MRMKTVIRSAVAAVSLGLVATVAYPLSPSSEEHVGVNAERGDPARWHVPADTPRLKFEAQSAEARAALSEAQMQCRMRQAGRATCVADANAQYRLDMKAARALLAADEGSAARVR